MPEWRALSLLDAVMDDGRLTSLDKLVLLALVRRADGEGACYPGTADLTRMTGLSRRTIFEVRAHLRAQGVIEWEPGCPGRSNVYRVLSPSDWPDVSAPGALGQGAHSGSAPGALGQGAHSGSAPGALGQGAHSGSAPGAPQGFTKGPGKKAPPTPPPPGEPDPPEFAALYRDFPRHVKRGNALRAWRARRREGHTPEAMHAAVAHYAAFCIRLPVGMEHRMHCSTFLGIGKPFLEWVDGIPPDEQRRLEERRHEQPTAPRRAAFGAHTSGQSSLDRFVRGDGRAVLPGVRSGAADPAS